MNEIKMNELVQKLVANLQEEHQQSLDSHPYFSVLGREFELLVDWKIGNYDIPDSVRVLEKKGDRGYLACIRFDVDKSVDSNDNSDVGHANFTFDEAEYDLEGIDGRITLMEMILEDIFS